MTDVIEMTTANVIGLVVYVGIFVLWMSVPLWIVIDRCRKD